MRQRPTCFQTRGIVLTLLVPVLLLSSAAADVSFSQPQPDSRTADLDVAALHTASYPAPGSVEQWTSLTASAGTPPLARQGYSLAYDPLLKEVVLFGGLTTSNNPLGDTWEFSEGSWHNITADSPAAPPARWAAGLVYDSALGGLLLFGGQDEYGADYFNDTWEFSAAGWTQLHPTNSPPPRGGNTMVYDSTDGYALLWGESVVDGPQTYWEFAGGTWTNITATVTGSLPNAGIFGADNPAGGDVVFFGGTRSCEAGMGLTYSYSDGAFHNLTSSEPARPLAGDGSLVMTYDPAMDGVLLFSGYTTTCTLTSETWVFHNGTWVNLTSESAPPAPGRWDAQLAYDVALGGAVTFSGNENPVGGINDFGDDTWEYSSYNVNASVSPMSGSAPLTFNFSSDPTGGFAPYSFNWSFDDGTSNSTSASGSHIYHDPGNYTVSLTVHPSTGGIGHESFEIQVASLTPLPTPVTTTFSNTDLYAIVGAILVLAVAILVAAVQMRSRGRPPTPAQSWSIESKRPPP